MAEFTHDWFGRYAAYWQELFASRGWRPDTPRTIVEIGSYEGRSALWMLENLLQHPQSRLHCVDIFHDREHADSYWRRFEANVLRSPHAGKVSVTVSASLPFLLRFIAAGNRADFIYVDGSHRAAEVLEDLVLAFHATRRAASSSATTTSRSRRAATSRSARPSSRSMPSPPSIATASTSPGASRSTSSP